MLCPICREFANDATPSDGRDHKIVDCPSCGTYEISGTTIAIFEKTDEASRRAALDNAKARAGSGERPLVLSSEYPLATEHVATGDAPAAQQSTIDKIVQVFASIFNNKGNIRLYLVVSIVWIIGAVIYTVNNRMGDEQLFKEAMNTVGYHCDMPTTTYDACVNNASLGRTLLGRGADDLSPYQNVNTYEDYKRIQASIASLASGAGYGSSRSTLDDKQLHAEYAELKKKLDAQKTKRENEQKLSEKNCKKETDAANSVFEQCMSGFEAKVNSRRAEIEFGQSASNILAVVFVPVIVPLFAAICVVMFFLFQGIQKWVSEGYKNGP